MSCISSGHDPTEQGGDTECLGSLRVESSSMGKTITLALKVDEILQCKKNTFALAKRDPGLQHLLSTTRKLICLTLMHSNVINLERIFTLCLSVGGGRLFNLMETEDLFIFILRFGGDSFRQSFIWNTISRESPSTTVVMQQEIHGSLLNTSFEELGRKGRKSRG